MPNGFIGRPATRYLTDVSTAHEEAVSAGGQIPRGVPFPPKARQLPFSPEDVRAGASGRNAFATGKRNSSNIVADQREYEDILRRISHADDKMGECLYRVSQEIEDICQTIYRLPEAVPRCLNVANSVKNLMGEFRSLTEETIQEVHSYARDIDDIGH